MTISVAVVARDLTVQRVRRFEHQRAPAGAAEGEQECLQHLVAPVGAQEVLGRQAEERTQRLAEVVRAAVGIPVPGDVAQRFEIARDELGRRWVGTLVGVEPHRDVDLG